VNVSTVHKENSRDGHTCSIEESFVENQKHQRAAKSVCIVDMFAASVWIYHT